MKKDLLNGLTNEQIAKVQACKDREELLVLAKSEGIELTDEQLEAVNGGTCTEEKITCRKCKSTNVSSYQDVIFKDIHYKCNNCGNEWKR